MFLSRIAPLHCAAYRLAYLVIVFLLLNVSAVAETPVAVPTTTKNVIYGILSQASDFWESLTGSGECGGRREMRKWIPDAEDRGYWVLCVNEQGSGATVYSKVAQVTANSPFVTLTWESDIRASISEGLSIRSNMTLAVQNFTEFITPVPLHFKKQPWALFRPETDSNGDIHIERIVPGTETSSVLRKKSGLYILLEGGLWRWPPMRIGYNRHVNADVDLVTIAVRPAIFDVRISNEIESLIQDEITPLVKAQNMKRSVLSAQGGKLKVNTRVRSSYTSFIDYSDSVALRELLRLAAGRLLFVENGFRAYGTGGFEDHIQAVKYKARGHYSTHRDYWDPREYPPEYNEENHIDRGGYWSNRHATILWYLQKPRNCTFSTKRSCFADGGETWFPRALVRGATSPSWDPNDQTSNFDVCDPNIGILVKPVGSALFYSLRADGEMDDYSWHSGCPVAKDVTIPKLIVNMWIWNNPSRQSLQAWEDSRRTKGGEVGEDGENRKVEL